MCPVWGAFKNGYSIESYDQVHGVDQDHGAPTSTAVVHIHVHVQTPTDDHLALG